jgi:hypothetical protein
MRRRDLGWRGFELKLRLKSRVEDYEELKGSGRQTKWKVDATR